MKNEKNKKKYIIYFLATVIYLIINVWVLYILFRDILQGSGLLALTSLLISPNQMFIIMGIFFLIYGFFYHLPLVIRISPFISLFLSLPIILGFLYKIGIIINIIGLLLLIIMIFYNLSNDYFMIFRNKSQS